MGHLVNRGLSDQPRPERTVMVPIEREQHEALARLVVESEGILPVSIESLVAMAVDAMLDGANVVHRSKCRHCQVPIVHETVTTEGFLPRSGWSDGHPRYPFHCPHSISLSHEPGEVAKS